MSIGTQTEHERPFPLSKDVLDTVNSLSWFLLDAFWMMEFISGSYAMVLPTVVTGLSLLYIEKRRNVFFINLAVNAWILMNCLWMFADTLGMPQYLWGAKAAFVAGVGFVAVAVVTSQDIRQTFSHFRRFRFLKI